MSMKSMTMIPPMSRRRSSRALAAADERAGVDVDDGERLGVVDHQIAAAGQVDPAGQRRIEHLVDPVGLQERLLAVPQLDLVDEVRRGATEEGGQSLVLLLVVDDRTLEVGGEDVPHDADRQVGLLEDERRGAGFLDALLQHLAELEQVEHLPFQVGPHRALGRGADDRAAAPQVQFGGLAAQPLTFLVVKSPGDADPLAVGRVHHVAPGDREVHRQPRTLGLQRVLDDLDDNLLAGLEQVGDVAPVLGLPAPAARRLDAGQHDLVDVQEAVLLQADVDERSLQAGEDVVDAPLVDVADDRSRTPALEVDLGDAVRLGRLGRAAPAPSGRDLGGLARCGATAGLQQRHTGFPTIDADQHLLLQFSSFL
jgi:hypothetical protein